VFLKANDPTALRAWYRDHLGMDLEDGGGMAFLWNRPDGPGEKGAAIWSVFDEQSKYFGPGPARVMVNYIVNDLPAVLAALREEGCDVDES
jgi:catechol 2,3-dioxygenase-like lactoylglutathione lyase family enzyme